MRYYVLVSSSLQLAIFPKLSRKYIKLGQFMEKSGNIRITMDKSEIDANRLHFALTQTYWAKDRTIEETMKTIELSRCYSLFVDNKFAAFARVLSDEVVFAYLMDVIVIEEFKGQGLSVELVGNILNDPVYEHIQKWCLTTKDAHGLYRKFGFTELSKPELMMELVNYQWT